MNSRWQRPKFFLWTQKSAWESHDKCNFFIICEHWADAQYCSIWLWSGPHIPTWEKKSWVPPPLPPGFKHTHALFKPVFLNRYMNHKLQFPAFTCNIASHSFFFLQNSVFFKMESATAFSSDGSEVIQRSLDVGDHHVVTEKNVHSVYEIQKCVHFINSNGFKRVCTVYKYNTLLSFSSGNYEFSYLFAEAG